MLDEFIIGILAAAIFALVVITAILESRFRRENIEFTARISEFRSEIATLRRQHDLQAGRIAIADDFDKSAARRSNTLGLAMYRLGRELFQRLSDHGLLK